MIEPVAAEGAELSPAPGTAMSYWPHSRMKRAYLDYLMNKQDEIEEQKISRRYYHSDQYNKKMLDAYKARKQPVVTFNRIGRKIDGVVGLIERLRQDPKAYPRTPKQEQGAELATAALRYCLDEQEWKAKSPEVARAGAVDGIGGIALEIIPGDQGDAEIGFYEVEPDSFFYDYRSYKPDFSDAGYMGEGRWLTIEKAVELVPDKESEIRATGFDTTDLTTDPDRENKWFSGVGDSRIIRVVDIWYQHKGKWCWALFTGSNVLMEGESFLVDEKGKTECRYVMYSSNIDHDGDRYGFVRNMKSAQDEYNARRSKALHILNSRRLIISMGALQDVETARKEWARPDGVVVVNGVVNDGAKADDQSFDFAGQLKMMENAIQELENYGPNQALIGDSANQSGRAIQLLQQAGMAELGPYIAGYRGWKIRVYRAIWNAIRKYWTAERWVRVTDDEGTAQFIQINGQTDPQTGQQAIDPQTGAPAIVNAIGSLDVDIIIDEGADTINAQADLYETMSHVLPSIAPMLTPPQAQAAINILINSSAIDATSKKQFRDATAQSQQPNPAAQQAQQIQLAGEAAKVDETKSKTALNLAKAGEAGQPQDGAQPSQDYQLPPEIQNAKAMAEINDKSASADHKRAQAYHITTQANLAPIELMHDTAHKSADRLQLAAQAQHAHPT